MVVSQAAPSFAQTGGAVYAELGGIGYFYSLNVEQAIAQNRTVRGGGMVLPASTTIAAGTVSINQLIGGRNQYLVLGAGLTFGGGYDFDLNAGTATIGYRYLRPGGLFLQLAATPFFTRYGAHGWSGISIGKSF